MQIFHHELEPLNEYEFNVIVSDLSPILDFLHKHHYSLAHFPDNQWGHNTEGEIWVKAYPIQGLLKYHGLSDKNNRIAYFSSISVNNDAAFTVSKVKFTKQLRQDEFILNGEIIPPSSSEWLRLHHQIESIRKLSGTSLNICVVSRNVMQDQHSPVGKGLGTSAAGGAAVAHAAVNLLYPRESELYNNPFWKSILARYLAGSASRSSVGGIALWLNSPQMTFLDSYSIRLDDINHILHEFSDNIALITISFSSSLRTDQAHDAAPLSPFFEIWKNMRTTQILEFMQALFNNDFHKVGQMSEYDTLMLHAVVMTAPLDQSLLVWIPETLQIMHLTRKLRNEGIPVYFLVDTGPSIVLLTIRKFASEIVQHLLDVNSNWNPVIGRVAGPPETLSSQSPERSVLTDDLAKYHLL